MKKNSTTLGRYTSFDELVIPKGKRSNVHSWEIFRKICLWKDIVVRMFVLDQEHRVELLRSQNYSDYKGTII